MVIFVLVVAALPVVAVVAGKNFPGDSPYSTSATQGEDFSIKREQMFCTTTPDEQLKQKECEGKQEEPGQ